MNMDNACLYIHGLTIENKNLQEQILYDKNNLSHYEDKIKQYELEIKNQMKEYENKIKQFENKIQSNNCKIKLIKSIHNRLFDSKMNKLNNCIFSFASLETTNQEIKEKVKTQLLSIIQQIGIQHIEIYEIKDYLKKCSDIEKKFITEIKSLEDNMIGVFPI